MDKLTSRSRYVAPETEILDMMMEAGILSGNIAPGEGSDWGSFAPRRPQDPDEYEMD
jgi:hypothetical protein